MALDNTALLNLTSTVMIRSEQALLLRDCPAPKFPAVLVGWHSPIPQGHVTSPMGAAVATGP